MRRWHLTLLTFVVAFVWLSVGASREGLAAGYTDPIAQIEAQDEALYSSIALRMAERGDWLTPNFLGRYALVKPPLAMWMSAAAVKLFGAETLWFRLPSLLAGAGVVALLFWYLAKTRTYVGAVCSAVVLLCTSEFQFMARRNFTDMPLLLFNVLAVVLILEGRYGWAGFAAGLAMMTKSVAGVPPLLVMAIVAPWRETVRATAIAAAVVLPWHLYQLAVHPHWFWTEYVLDEHLAWGAAAPAQTTDENGIVFYVKRFFLLGPVAAVLGLASLKSASKTVWVWFAVSVASLALFGYRSATYLLPLYAAMAMAAGMFMKWRYGLLAVIPVALFTADARHMPDRVPSANELNAYAKQSRGRELFIVEPDDEFLSATLPLRKVHYVWFGDPEKPRGLQLDYRKLGITLSVDDYLRLDEVMPAFAAQLRAMDLPSTEPVGTVVIARDREELAKLAAAAKGADFYYAPQKRFVFSQP